MQIAYFTNIYLPIINGVVRSVNTYRRSLTEMGNNVFIFAQENNYEDKERFVFRYPSMSLPISVDIPAAIPISPYIDWLLPYLKLDVIHAHHPILLGQTAMRKAEKLGLPLVFTYHTRYNEYTHYFPIPQETVQEFLKEAVHEWMRYYMRRCQHIIVPSQSLLDMLKNNYGLQSNYSIIPTGIDLAPYREADGEPIRQKHGWQDDIVMISVGRLAKEKNWDLFLHAAAIALKKHPKLRVVILGDGPDRKALEKLARSLGISKCANFLGNVPFEQVPAYLKAADFFGFASTTETQGLVTLEALAADLPVVAVNASGTCDIVQDGVQGLLVEESVEAMAAGIDKLLGHPEMMASFKDAATARAEDFEIKRLTGKLLDVYAQAIEEKKAGRTVKVQGGELLPNFLNR
jgi:1,2-diacylglycerol 3-alpha-glucosyltransferase